MRMYYIFQQQTPPLTGGSRRVGFVVQAAEERVLLA
jgi:hypothetical protein